jgi:hypothetical protein
MPFHGNTANLRCDEQGHNAPSQNPMKKARWRIPHSNDIGHNHLGGNPHVQVKKKKSKLARKQSLNF